MKKILLSFVLLLGGVLSSSATTTEIWSGEKIIDWNANAIVVDKALFASANVGDVLHITVSAVSGGYPQVGVAYPGSGTDIEPGKHLEAAGVIDIPVTGDMLKCAKVNGLQFKGDGMTITSITLESGVYEGRPNDAIWVGNANEGFQVNKAHLNLMNIEAGDIIKVNFSTAGSYINLCPSQKGPSDWNWDNPYSLTKVEEADNVQFTVNDALVTNPYHLIVNTNYSVTSVQVIKKEMTDVATLWSGEKVFSTWDDWFILPDSKFLSAKAGYKLRFTITNLFETTVGEDHWNHAMLFVKNGSNWSDLENSGEISLTATVPYVYEMTFTAATLEVAKNYGIIIQGRGYTITKVELVPNNISVSISEYEWATFCSGLPLDFTECDGLLAYIVTGHEGTTLTKTQITGTVPANTPLLLNAAKGNYTIPAIASSTTNVSANLLKAGTGAAVSAESGKTKYVLSVTAGKAEFQKINATAATVPTGKAYLEFNEAIEARSLDFDDEGTTAIKNMKVGENDNIYYDLQGRRVLYPKNGLYIVNGKKVIVK